jgi:hypothetical protein
MSQSRFFNNCYLTTAAKNGECCFPMTRDAWRNPKDCFTGEDDSSCLCCTAVCHMPCTAMLDILYMTTWYPFVLLCGSKEPCTEKYLTVTPCTTEIELKKVEAQERKDKEAERERGPAYMQMR